MSIERKYIEKTIENMEREINVSKTVIETYKKDEENLGPWRQGNISSSKRHIEFLEIQIEFLKGALED